MDDHVCFEKKNGMKSASALSAAGEERLLRILVRIALRRATHESGDLGSDQLQNAGCNCDQTQLDPPREAWETAEYEDDPFALGDIDETKLKIVSKDFLPKPEELVFKCRRRKVTITLDQASIDFFKAEAQRLHVPYQRMIRTLLQAYVERVQQARQHPPAP